ncbi:heterokaryon incompatibility protein-domain-containing protein [Dactylonectria estremocensis]|uniref:Heterokaryon incompatibility protein-domain-containing protein n=1 Tax=Dactylonectria estremocensis TaxID=1079267 RepID=A0A9P9EUW4_9HYPO|nr:heterokaryon incompatibility protein-domain-containing protein [Dactylonectria estremocensis]
MWLVDVDTFRLKYFHDPPHQYAILSHTWGGNEVVFKDMDDIPRARQKDAWLKIQLTCDEARKNMLPYAWIDSCCIDKSSSAELSEAINSMLEWYRQSTCCYAYLEDFNLPLKQNADTISRAAFDQLTQCRWFTRGWTLQELIAPTEVVFFSRAWEMIGTKETLKHDLAEITGIEKAVLENVAYMSAIPVGRRMSWAAKRQTTRVEDMAYCLMGIFNVNMPLLYGEREKAFIRLQEEIARQHRDLSLFAWRQQDSIPQYRGIFANSPAEFIDCNSLVS